MSTGTDQDPSHYTGPDTNPGNGVSASNVHAMFRDYSPTAGSWMSPDPYAGSYDLNNPQSLNRYAYVLNNPLSLVDPTGLDVPDEYCYDPSYGGCTTVTADPNPPIPLEPAPYSPQPTPPHPPPFNGPTNPAPNNGTPKPTLLSCTATKNVALALGATALDGFGAVPLGNEVTGSIQIGAGVVSAGITVYAGNANNAGLGSTGLGLAIAGKCLGKGALELIPVLGNSVSGISAVYDVFGEDGVIDSYQKCLAGH